MYSFLICNHSVVPCPVLTVASWLAYRFLRRQVRWSVIPMSLRIFHSLLWSKQSKTLAQSIKQKEMFSWNSCFFKDPTDVGNLISGSSDFSKSRFLNSRWKFLVHVLLKPSLKDFEQTLTSLWNEHNCMVVQTSLDIAFLWDWNENWPFPVLWPLLSFPNLLTH